MKPEDRKGVEPLDRFLQRVWRQDVAPLLRGKYAAHRRTGAKVGGAAAGGAGLLLDGLLKLRGRPFTRAFSVLGASLGAILPDAWSFDWLRMRADADDQRVIAEQLARRADELSDDEALALFGLNPAASRADLQDAWRAVAQRWHPDKAPDAATRTEHQTRFVAYQAAYQRLGRSYDAGSLPRG